jgi:hypothetical protein
MDPVERHFAAQLDLIQGLILEGRRSIVAWGWLFVLWGVGHVVAITWSSLWTSNPGLPWLVVMGACGIATAVACTRAGLRSEKSTVMSRAQGATWAAFSISLAVLWAAGLVTRRLDFDHLATLYEPFFVLIGGANFTSGITVKLPVQAGVGALWWGAAVVNAVFPSATLWVLMMMALVGEIAFGLYLVVLDRKRGSSVELA